MNTEKNIIEVNIDDIIPNRFQPRIAFDEKGLQELAASIKEHGIIQPLVLRKLGKKYEIIAGERRYKASTLAGLTKVPAIISNIDDNKSAEVALVENIQRRDLTPIEEARSYKNLLDKGYLTQEQLAKKMGLSQSTIANKLRLLNLDESVQQALLEGKISERHARSLLLLPNQEDQKEWLNKIINERLTVRQLDQEIKKLKDNDDNSTSDIPLVNLTPNIEDIQINSTDLYNNNKKNNVANMLVPEETMTENSEQLPQTDNINNEPIINEQPLNDPNNMAMPSSNNRFFTNLEQEPAALNNLNEVPNESATGFTFDQNPVNSGIEIFDVPTNQPINPSPASDITIEPQTNEKIEINNGPIEELNPNNKFFQPLPEQNLNSIDNMPMMDIPSNPVNPMENLESTPTEPVQESISLPTAINEIRRVVNEMQQKGLNIRLDEADLEGSYQINVIIEK